MKRVFLLSASLLIFGAVTATVLYADTDADTETVATAAGNVPFAVDL